MPESKPKRPLRGTELKRFHRAVRRELAERRRLAFVLENVNYPVNVGSLVRIADAVDASLALCGTTPDPDQPTAARVGRGKHHRVPWRRYEDAPAAVADLATQGFEAIGVEITADARAYHEQAWPEAVALVLGNEDHGLTRAALAACKHTVYLPMLGRGRSLNVHVAAAVVAYRALLSPPSSPST